MGVMMTRQLFQTREKSWGRVRQSRGRCRSGTEELGGTRAALGLGRRDGKGSPCDRLSHPDAGVRRRPHQYDPDHVLVHLRCPDAAGAHFLSAGAMHRRARARLSIFVIRPS